MTNKLTALMERQREDVEKTFDLEFNRVLYVGKESGFVFSPEDNDPIADFKSFLSRVQRELVEAVVEEVEGMKKGRVEGEDELWAAHYLGYDEALSTVKEKLTNAITSKEND